jgi:hypothetical protein
MKPKSAYNPIYKVNYYFCIGWKPEAFTKYIAKHFDYKTNCGLSDGKTIFATSDQGAILLIWTRRKNDYAVLSHECVHAANYTFEHIGHKLSTSNDEPQAYLVEYLMTEALK